MPILEDHPLSDDERELIRDVGFDPEQVEPGSLALLREVGERPPFRRPPTLGFAMRGSDGVRRRVRIEPLHDLEPLAPFW